MAGGQGLPPPGWEKELLSRLNAPDVKANEQFFDDWAAEEHGSGASSWGGRNEGGAYNPFDTTLGAADAQQPWYVGEAETGQYPGSIYNTSAGVMSYDDWQIGEDATAATLEQTNMAPILDALQSGQASVSQLESAEGQTPWGKVSSWPSNAKVNTSNTSGISSMPGFSKLPKRQQQLLLEEAKGVESGNTTKLPAALGPGSPLSKAAQAIYEKWYTQYTDALYGKGDAGAVKPGLNLPGVLGQIADALGNIADTLAKGGVDAFKILAWLTKPQNWLRIFCGIAGLIFAVGGGVALVGVF